MKKIFMFLGLFLLTVAICSVKPVYAITYSSYLERSIPQNYYSGLDTNQNSGDFIADLCTIISRNHTRTSYGSGMAPILVESDPALGKSNQITCFYTGVAYSSGWNKEHVWCKSHGFPSSSTDPYCDLHHLRPTKESINSSRGNKDFGEVSNPTGQDEYGNKWNSGVFEPRDEVKGDVARILFYMATRYSEAPFSLKLVNSITTSASDSNGRLGDLATLLKWHYQDPVSASEIHRNEVVYGYQKNRNPYIDHPEYVDIAFPNSYATSNNVTKVINLINGLPTTITLAVEEDVLLVKNQYDLLSTDEKAQVTNYQKLVNALNKIEELKSENTVEYLFTQLKTQVRLNIYYEDDESVDLIETDYVGNFDTVKAENYKNVLENNLITKVTLSNSSESTFDIKGIKVGSSSKAGSVDFNISQGIEFSKVSFAVSPWKSSGSLTGTVSESRAVVEVTMKDGTKNLTNLVMDEDKTYDLSVGVDGEISSICVKSETGGTRFFIHSITLTSNSGLTQNYIVNHIFLDVGRGNMSPQFTNSYRYGVIYSNSLLDTSLINLSNLSSYNYQYCEIKNGEMISSIDINNLNAEYFVCCFIVVDGQLYFMEQTSYSVSDLIDYYLTNKVTLGLSNKEVQILEAIS